MKMHKKTRSNINLTLIGESFSTRYVSEKLQIHAEYIREKDEKLKNGRLFGHTEWGVSSGWSVNLEVDELLEEFFGSLKDKLHLLRSISISCNAKWDLLICMEIYNEEKPSLVFPRKLMPLFAHLDMEIGVDYYFF